MLDYNNDLEHEDIDFCLNCGGEIGRDGICWNCEREPIEGD